MRRLLRMACGAFLTLAVLGTAYYPAMALVDAIPSKVPVFSLPQEPRRPDKMPFPLAMLSVVSGVDLGQTGGVKREAQKVKWM